MDILNWYFLNDNHKNKWKENHKTQFFSHSVPTDIDLWLDEVLFNVHYNISSKVLRFFLLWNKWFAAAVADL